MTRRRLVALVSAGVLLLIALGVVALLVAVTQTDFGRNRVRGLAMGALKVAMRGRGSIYFGKLGGNFVTGFTVDSIAIRDSEDSLFLATGPVRVQYDPRDLLDKRIRLDLLDIQHPVIDLRRHADHSWNFQRIFPSGPPSRTHEPKFGDYVVMDSVALHDGSLLLTEPWDAADSLHGARRDSATRAALRSTDHEIRRTSEGLKQTRRFAHLELVSSGAHIADPDSAGRVIQVARLDVDVSDPPFDISHASGLVRILGDSVWLTMRHFDLPGSTGSASGKVWWGNDLPTRYDLHIAGDSVSMADIAWVYPTLPRTGGGRMQLAIRNERDLHVLDYVLTQVDVRTAKSHLTGAMTFGVGKPVLIVKDVSLAASPLDFAFLRALNGGPFPVNWNGEFTGTVRGPGGPVDRFQIDEARLTFRDANVPGAVSRFMAHGGVDILSPAQAKFHALALNVGTLDLRTIHYLFPSFPRLAGTITGTATLDSIWTDVRFRDADVAQHDGPGPATHVTGSGRITYAEPVAFDVTLDASPLAFTTLARSYPGLPLRGSYSGPLRITGTMAHLAVRGSLSGPAGQFGADGVFDLEPPVYGAQGTVSARELDVAGLLDRSDWIATSLTGRITGQVAGDSLPHLVGSATVSVDSTRVDREFVTEARAGLRFGDGRLHVDSMRVVSSAGHGTASGALGLAAGTVDSLAFDITMDSLGGLRPYLASAAPERVAGTDSAADDPSDADSLAGTLHGTGVLVGSIDTASVHGTFTGSGLYYAGNRVTRVQGTYAFRDVPYAPAGTLTGRLDTTVVAGVRLDTISAALAMPSAWAGTLALGVVSDAPRGTYRGGALMSFRRAADTIAVTLDSARVTLKDHGWHLAQPAHLTTDSTGSAIDSLVVVSDKGGVVSIRGRFPQHEFIDGELRGDSVSLADVGTLLQTPQPLAGWADATLQMSGARQNPVLRFRSRYTAMQVGDVHLPALTLDADYADQRLGGVLELLRNGTVVLTARADAPVNLALASVPSRALRGAVHGSVRADSVDLTAFEAVSPLVTNLVGRAAVAIDIGGTTQQPVVTGDFRIHGGAMTLPKLGIRLHEIESDIGFAHDSVRITRLTGASAGLTGSSVSLTGAFHVPSWRSAKDLGFDLTLKARNFQAIDKRSFARLEMSGNAQVTGTLDRPVLQGDMTLDRGTIYISDIYQKQVVDLNDPEAFSIVDTNLVENLGLLESSPVLDSLVTHLRIPSLSVRIGDDVWLRSEEANIKLAGSMDLAKAGTQRVESGRVRVSRGTYRLDLAGIVQRTFQVDSGFVTFYGDPHLAPELNVWASYLVRQANRQIGEDVRVIAHIGGTLRHPSLELSSDARFAMSNTEILSYLVFGQPSFTTTSDATTNPVLQQVAAALLPSVGAVLERALADQVGFIDYVQVQTGTTGEQGVFSTTGASSFLSGTRIGIGKQIGEKTFVMANAGLCQLAGTQSGISFGQSIGLTVEHQLGDGYSLQASIEPSTAALQCRPGLTTIGSRPPQYGFDLFREWTF